MARFFDDSHLALLQRFLHAIAAKVLCEKRRVKANLSVSPLNKTSCRVCGKFLLVRVSEARPGHVFVEGHQVVADVVEELRVDFRSAFIAARIWLLYRLRFFVFFELLQLERLRKLMQEKQQHKLAKHQNEGEHDLQ